MFCFSLTSAQLKSVTRPSNSQTISPAEPAIRSAANTVGANRPTRSRIIMKRLSSKRFHQGMVDKERELILEVIDYLFMQLFKLGSNDLRAMNSLVFSEVPNATCLPSY